MAGSKIQRGVVGLAVVVFGLTVAACGSGSSSATTQQTITVQVPGGGQANTMTQANAACNKAIESDKVITTADVKACNIANVPTANPCLSGPPVYEAWVAPDNDALLRVGYKPVVYTATTTDNPNPPNEFTTSTITQLCGDPIDPSMTPPPPPLTQAQVHQLFRK
jgi:hypothetical protein